MKSEGRKVLTDTSVLSSLELSSLESLFINVRIKMDTEKMLADNGRCVMGEGGEKTYPIEIGHLTNELVDVIGVGIFRLHEFAELVGDIVALIAFENERLVFVNSGWFFSKLTQKIQELSSRVLFEICFQEEPNKSVVLVGRVIRLLTTIVGKISLHQNIFKLTRSLYEALVGDKLLYLHCSAVAIVGHKFSTKTKRNTRRSLKPLWRLFEVVKDDRLRSRLLMQVFLWHLFHAREGIGDFACCLNLML